MTSSRFTEWPAFIALSPMDHLGIRRWPERWPEPPLRPCSLCDRRAERALSASSGTRLVWPSRLKFGDASALPNTREKLLRCIARRLGGSGSVGVRIVAAQQERLELPGHSV